VLSTPTPPEAASARAAATGHAIMAGKKARKKAAGPASIIGASSSPRAEGEFRTKSLIGY